MPKRNLANVKIILAEDLRTSVKYRDESELHSAIREIVQKLELKMNFDDLSDYLVGLLVKYTNFDPDNDDIEFIDNGLRTIPRRR